MKISYSDFLTCIKTRVQPSCVIDGLWIARSMIGVRRERHIHSLFGFAAAFDYNLAETRATFELLEHVVFSPFLHSENSVHNPVLFVDGLQPESKVGSVKQFLMGVSGFYGNGCAVSFNKQQAIDHSKRELLERHVCCEIWYKNIHPLWQVDDFYEPIAASLNLKFYTTDLDIDGKFIMATLDSPEMNFFALGAAIKSTMQDAIMHAAGEVIMLFEDVKKGRAGFSSNNRSEQHILSLRDQSQSWQRKKHFEKILQANLSYKHETRPLACQTIVFEPFENLFAARSFSLHALDPRHYEKMIDVPVLPLF